MHCQYVNIVSKPAAGEIVLKYGAYFIPATMKIYFIIHKVPAPSFFGSPLLFDPAPPFKENLSAPSFLPRPPLLRIFFPAPMYFMRPKCHRLDIPFSAAIDKHNLSFESDYGYFLIKTMLLLISRRSFKQKCTVNM